MKQVILKFGFAVKSVLVLSLVLLLGLVWGQAAFAQSNDVLVIDYGGVRVLRFNGATGLFIEQFIAPNSGGLIGPQNIAIGPDGNVYVSSHGTGSIKRYDINTGAFLNNFVPSGRGGLANPDQLIFHSDGKLYVSDRFASTIRRYNGRTGAFIDNFVVDGALGGFVDFTFGPDGNLYASMFNGLQCIRRYNGTTGALIDQFYCPPNASSAMSGLAFAPDGTLFASRFHLGQVWHISTGGTLLKKLKCPGDTNADALHFGPDGKLYLTDQAGSNISRFDPVTGACLGDLLSGATINSTKGFVFTPAKTTITIRQDSQPDNRQNFRFIGDLGIFRLDDANPDDGDAYPNAQSFTVQPGRYSVREILPIRWQLSSLTCSGGNTAVDLARQRVTITVVAGDNVACTFVTSPQPGVTAAELETANDDAGYEELPSEEAASQHIFLPLITRN